LAFGPLIYAESLGTVAAMLLLAVAALVAPRPRGVPVIAKTIRALAVVAPLLAWMLASATWSLNGAASATLMLRFCALLSAGTLFVTSFGVLPLERLRRPLTALALGLSAAGATVAADLLLGGHLARVLHGPLPEGFDPALEYGRAATLHAILLIPVVIGLLGLRAPRLAAGYALLGATAILETSSLSAKTALAIGLLCFAMVFILPQLRWAGLALLGLGAIALPAMFPVKLDPGATCWLADRKPSALHRLEIWGFVAEHIEQRPIAGWGLDAARRLPGGAAPVIIRHCDAAGRSDGVALSSVILPLHPHNAILQLWLELGGVGIVLSFAPLIALFQHAFRAPAWRSRLTQATICGSAAAAAPVALVSFGIWQEWFLSGLFVVAAFVVLAARLSSAACGDTVLSKVGALGVD
jgi:O-antigen ligase